MKHSHSQGGFGGFGLSEPISPHGSPSPDTSSPHSPYTPSTLERSDSEPQYKISINARDEKRKARREAAMNTSRLAHESRQAREDEAEEEGAHSSHSVLCLLKSESTRPAPVRREPIFTEDSDSDIGDIEESDDEVIDSNSDSELGEEEVQQLDTCAMDAMFDDLVS
ncbi:hypothetical protein B484DRAFT_440496, partial [Ochromonadaceae sp. CCMP2298]